jgi:hypothetical protein
MQVPQTDGMIITCQGRGGIASKEKGTTIVIAATAAAVIQDLVCCGKTNKFQVTRGFKRPI